jgi:diphosphomevalonate decarboxylase
MSRAIACANIALAKYWGKSDVALNLPAVPSLSLTLEGLETHTEVTLLERPGDDRVVLDGTPASPSETARVSSMLDRVRALAGSERRAEVVTENRFPTASGLASSASGFAALAGAACAAFGLDADDATLSRLARASSASAARSVFGGFSRLPAGTPGDDSLAATPLFGPDHWDVRLVIAVATSGRKKIGSTEGMERSRLTSPFYEAWVEAAPGLEEVIAEGVTERDIGLVGPRMEQSTMAFHACAMASSPAVLYLAPTTLAVLERVRALRDEGVAAYATMDAGPHVKILCEARDEARVVEAARLVEGVLRVQSCRPGPGLRVER